MGHTIVVARETCSLGLRVVKLYSWLPDRY